MNRSKSKVSTRIDSLCYIGAFFYCIDYAFYLFVLSALFKVLFNFVNFQKTDVTVELVEELQVKTKEFLQPNPTARAKMAAVKGISKLSGQAKAATYPQPEGVLGDCMVTYGKKLGDDSVFGESLDKGLR
jgi:hypothetical protein